MALANLYGECTHEKGVVACQGSVRGQNCTTSFIIHILYGQTYKGYSKKQRPYHLETLCLDLDSINRIIRSIKGALKTNFLVLIYFKGTKPCLKKLFCTIEGFERVPNIEGSGF